MFASQYFAQWYFAGNFFQPVPAPTPVPEVVCERFAIGRCIGTPGPAPTPVFGYCGSNPGMLAIGTRGGNNADCGCP